MTRVYTSGVFDLFHVGHLRALLKAKALGDWLLVGISPDDDVVSYKRLPVIPFEQRMEIVQQLSCVDQVVQVPLVVDEAFYERHRIDIHCQGDEVPGYDFYASGRDLGILRIVGRDPTIDTSKIIETIVRDYSSTRVE